MTPAGSDRSWRLLRPYLAPHWPALASAGAATIVVTAAELAQPWPLKIVVDELLRNRGETFTLGGSDLWLLAAVAALVVGAALAGAAASYLSDVLLNRAGERIVHDLRVALYAHLQRLSLAFHDRRQKGDLVTRITGDVNAIGTLFSDSIGALASAGLLLAGMAIVCLVLDPVLAVAAFAVTPVLGIVTFRYRRRIKDLARLQRAEEGEIASLATETLGAMQVVKAFGSEDYESDRVETRSRLRRTIGVDAARAQARFSAVVDVLGAVAATAVLVLGVFRVAAGALTPGSLIVFAAYAARTYKPLREIARQAAKVSRATARADRIAEILAADDALRDRPGAYAGGRARGAVDLDAVTFAYTGGGRRALDDIALSVRPGARVAVVGPSGAGKSTLGALIARFYDPSAGVVRIDGRDARECRLSWLRDQVGFLLQDTVLFRGTVADNIAYGSAASRDEIEAAARAADAHEFVCGLPHGYDSELGPGGGGLSGGQRQRLGIARVLLRDPPILVLDEPTTGLDAASERQVLRGLDGLIRGRTTLIVTHSTALARRADRVVVLENGRVVEDGPPRELLGRRGVFRRLASYQGVGPEQRGRVPRDHALPQLRGLLDETEAGALLEQSRSLPAGSTVDAVRAVAVRYKPARRAIVEYEAVVDGESREAVAVTDRTGTGVYWLPFDAALPALAASPGELALRLRDRGLVVGHPLEVRRLGYKPLARAVLRLDGHVVKAYGTDAKYARAATAMRVVVAARPVRAPAYEGELPELRATVQAAVEGSIATDHLACAEDAGAVLRRLHRLDLTRTLPLASPTRHLGAAAEAGDVVRSLLPELSARVDALLRRFEETVPLGADLTCSHGDFEVGQLLVRPDGELVVLDVDELCVAPAAFDLATYAAHPVRGHDPDQDAAAAREVAEALVAGYERRPRDLRWYLATSVLIRAHAPFRKLDPDWPDAVAGVVGVAEELAP